MPVFYSYLSRIIMMFVVSVMMLSSHANAARIKDVVSVEGVRDNILMGYGLVVGLNGTGDRLRNNAFTEQSLIAFLERQGVNTRGTNLRTRNVAAVTVTATLPGFARTGSRLDVSVGAMGDARSLLGGTLLATPLYGADGNVYAVAQGPIAVGGFEAGGQSGTTVTKGVPTNGHIANGGIIEREIDFELNNKSAVRLALMNPDISTASNIAQAINARVGPNTASVSDPGTVAVRIPGSYEGDVAMLLADIEQMEIDTDQPARIVIDEATGTIVMGENVRIDTVAVAQGNLIVRVIERPDVIQPGAFAPPGAETTVVPRTDIVVDEGAEQRVAMLQGNATLRDLVAGLNALGVGPRDLITILQNIKASGAMQAEIQTR
ncbi:MAG: flagellar basal body P-ring protein FlgI [Alphaproteobacteria bacterium]|nr:MAG: flagellar basal body P-ring protein FlgI [Alphaproteobacteria bacterium]TAF77164.1 MAG: flagellar basal body P-ring protein FlgI [Alphaproteobacteria bacterium]